MKGTAVNELNRGLIEFGNALQSDTLAAGRAEEYAAQFFSGKPTINKNEVYFLNNAQ